MGHQAPGVEPVKGSSRSDAPAPLTGVAEARLSNAEVENGGSDLFSRTDVARLSDGVCGVGKYVVLENGTRGRVVAPSRGEGWWLVRLESKGRPLRQMHERGLHVRS